MEFTNDSGDTKYLAVRLAPIINNGEVIALINRATDITERIRMGAEQEKMVRLESIGTLAGGIAHDFNNYLTGILGKEPGIDGISVQPPSLNSLFLNLTGRELRD